MTHVRLAVAVAAACAAIAMGTPAHGQPLVQSTVVSENPANFTPNVLDGAVKAIAKLSGRMFVGGDFTSVAPAGSTAGSPRPYVFAFDADSGATDTAFAPVVDGEVLSILGSPDGTALYLAGAFNYVNGFKRPSIVRVDAATGATVTSFAPPAFDGVITDVELINGRLYVAGTFANVARTPRTAFAVLDAATGALISEVDAKFAGLHQGGRTHIEEMAVTPDGRTIAVVGNFTEVFGQPRRQLVLLDIVGGEVRLNPWFTNRFTQICGPSFDTYMRGVDFSPNGSFFAIATTGGSFTGTLCDSVTRWETKRTGDGEQQPSWIDYTGGDTVTSVVVVGSTVYAGGHFRWLNNPYARDRVGQGAVERSGIAALDARNGLPLTWNPGRQRGYGVTAWLATPEGLWMGHDTARVRTEMRARITYFPLSGGAALPAEDRGVLPAGVVALGRPGATAHPEVIHRINAGGPSLASPDGGPAWASDSATAPSPLHTSGSRTSASDNTWATTTAVPAATPWELFSTRRYDPAGGGEMQWSLPVASGRQTEVRLYFANRCSCGDAPGERLFDVTIDGRLVLDDYDIVREVGNHVGTMKSFAVTSDGRIDIHFGHVVENPVVSGIEVVDRTLTAKPAAGSDVARYVPFDGRTATPGGQVADQRVAWHDARGAMMIDGTLYTGGVDGRLYARTFDGATFGPPTAVPLNNLGDFSYGLQRVTGMFFDRGRLYYTLPGRAALYYRYFTPQSGVVGATRYTAAGNPAGLDWGSAAGMFAAGGRIYVASAVDGRLRAVDFVDGQVVPGSVVTFDDAGTDWRARGLFVRPGAPANGP